VVFLFTDHGIKRIENMSTGARNHWIFDIILEAEGIWLRKEKASQGVGRAGE